MNLTFFRHIFAAVMILLSTLPAHAGSTQLSQTGQTSCWDTSGASIPCAGTGQDGDKRIGATLPTPRFVDNGNGTLTDTLNGLVWLKNANCTDTVGGIAKPGGYLSWQDALTWSNALANGSCGLTDGSTAGQWRLPNRKELMSLVNRQELNSATWLNNHGFVNVQSYIYWQSSTYSLSPYIAWHIDMADGFVDYDDKTYSNYVWPVRAGQ